MRARGQQQPAGQSLAGGTGVRHGHDAPPVDFVECYKRPNPFSRPETNLACALFREAGDQEVSVRTGRENHLFGVHRRQAGGCPGRAGQAVLIDQGAGAHIPGRGIPTDRVAHVGDLPLVAKLPARQQWTVRRKVIKAVSALDGCASFEFNNPLRGLPDRNKV